MKLIKSYREYGTLCSFSKTFKAAATNSAFTLAEMMVVMLILSVILAAMAPVMTTRNKTDYSSPWKYTTQNPSNAYFGAGSAQIALIGQANTVEGDDIAKLVINTSDRSHIALKSGDSILARLHADNSNNLFFSNITNLPAGTDNTGIGVGPLHSLTSGSNNTAIGSSALYSNTTGGNNTAIGSSALYTNTTGGSNTAIGQNSLSSATTASSNTAIGNDSLSANTTGSNNTAIGNDSLSANTTGSNNTAIGNNALSSATTASNNTAIGDSSQNAVTTGEYNVSIGSNSMARETTGKYNTALGCDSMRGSTTGDYNIALGYRANYSETESYTMTGSIGIGAEAKSTADYAVAIGYSAASSSSAVAIGTEANASVGNSIAIGKNAATSDSGMIAIGNGAKAVGEKSIAIGELALNTNNPKGKYNLAIGYQALKNNNPSDLSHGSYNVAIGNYALKSNTSGSLNVALGLSAAEYITGNCNTIIGEAAGGTEFQSSENKGEQMVAVGYSARVASSGAIAIGSEANAYGVNGSSAANSIAIGRGANVYGSNAMAIGAGVVNYKDNVIQLGTENQTVYIPGNLIVGGNVALNLNQNATTRMRFYNSWYKENYYGPFNLGADDDGSLGSVSNPSYWRVRIYAKSWSPKITTSDTVSFEDAFKDIYSSDRRLKYVGKENTSGLDKIRQLKVFNYTYKKDTTKTPHVGVIAQDLQKVFPNAVKKGADGFLTIRMEDMFYALVNAVKELDAKITALQKENQELKAEMKRMNERLNKLEAKVK